MKDDHGANQGVEKEMNGKIREMSNSESKPLSQKIKPHSLVVFFSTNFRRII